MNTAQARGPLRIGLIGWGEVGRIFGAGLRPLAGVAQVSTWDIKLQADQPAHADAAGAMRRSAEAAGVALAGDLAALCADSDLLVSAVTASQTQAVAQAAAAHLRAGQWFLDLNSASPGTKQQCAECVQASGARYVEAGVMTSVPPYGIRVPMLLGGPHADALAARLAGWGMNARAVSDRVGVASAIKMCRSVMIKGLEALVIESYTTARAYGVEDHVLPTLAETFPGIDWPQTGAYFYSRVAQHGQRRAEEMREAALTVREAGFEPLMTAAIADKQQWMADLAAQGVLADLPAAAPWQAYADRLLRERG